MNTCMIKKNWIGKCRFDYNYECHIRELPLLPIIDPSNKHECHLHQIYMTRTSLANIGEWMLNKCSNGFIGKKRANKIRTAKKSSWKILHTRSNQYVQFLDASDAPNCRYKMINWIFKHRKYIFIAHFDISIGMAFDTKAYI